MSNIAGVDFDYKDPDSTRMGTLETDVTALQAFPHALISSNASRIIFLEIFPHASYLTGVDWSIITSIPLGFADGIDAVLTETEVDAFIANNGYADEFLFNAHLDEFYQINAMVLNDIIPTNTLQDDRLLILETSGLDPLIVASMSLEDLDGDLSNETIRFTGMNIQIVDGSGDTEGAVNGVGNLIVGYNELRGGGDDRSGSHNIELGMGNNYTLYGGAVFGINGEVSGRHATVLGGQSNTAAGDFSIVSGGLGNQASGNHSAVSGGAINTAEGLYSVVSGGYNNFAVGENSVVSGGYDNHANGDESVVSGGGHLTEPDIQGYLDPDTP